MVSKQTDGRKRESDDERSGAGRTETGGEDRVGQVRGAGCSAVVCVSVLGPVVAYHDPAPINALHEMVRRSLPDTPFYCVTDRPRDHSLHEDIQLLHAVDPHMHPGWWQKLALFQEDPWGLTGRMLFLDLDVVITGDLNQLIEKEGDLVLCPGFFSLAEKHGLCNSSVFLLEAGSHPEIWEKAKDRAKHPNAFAKLKGDQDAISAWLELTEDMFWDQGLILSYKKDVFLPREDPLARQARDPIRPLFKLDDAVVVAHHGGPKPWEALLDPMVQRFYPLSEEQHMQIKRNQPRFLGAMRIVG